MKQKIAVCCLTAVCLTLGSVGAVAYATGNPYENYKSADAQYAGISADIAGQSIKSEEYSDGSTRVQREDNTYSVENSKHEKDNESENLTPNMIKLAEMTADLFVGDLSNQFISSEIERICTSAAVMSYGKVVDTKSIYNAVIEYGSVEDYYLQLMEQKKEGTL